MNERIKNILNWAFALIIAGAVLLLVLFPQAFGAITPIVQKTGYMLTDPSMILLEYATRNAISQFGGDMSMEGFNSALLLGLSGIAIIFVIAPTLILFGYKKAETSDRTFRHAAWHLGTGIVLVAVGFGLYSSISFSSSKSNLTEATEREHALDELQFELIDLYFDASAKVFLPQEKGGGDGQFTNFTANDGSTRNIQLSDLDQYNPDSPFEFVMSENISDSTITISGVTDVEGNDPDFQNANGRTGKIQLTLMMNPYEDDRPNIQRQNEWLFADQVTEN